MAVFRVQFEENTQFVTWSRGRPADIQQMYDEPSQRDAAMLDGQPVNLPEGRAWVRYRDGKPMCAVIVASCNVLSITHRLCEKQDRLGLVRTMKRLEVGGYDLPVNSVDSLNSWDELYVHRHTEYESAHALLTYFGFTNVDDRLYRRSAAKLS